jgi:uncharacterized protein (DUF2062 family)
MPRKFIKRYLPGHQQICAHKHLRVFGSLLHDPNLWHLNRRSVAGAFAVGLFTAFIPVPGHMAIAGAGAIAARVNLPIAVALVWVTNPVTIPPLFYLAYKLGARLLDMPPHAFHFEMSLAWLTNELAAIWQPFLFGCLVLGTVSAALGYLMVRTVWRISVLRSWRLRKRRRSSLRSVP